MDKIPKGTLIPIGGAEKRVEKFHTSTELQATDNQLEVLSRVVSEMKGQNTRIEVVTSASSIPEVIGQMYLHSFQSLECAEVGLLNLRNKKDVLKKEFLKRLERADGIMFSGGNQIRLTRSYLDTPFYDLLLERYYQDPEFVIAGTSAGAMMMSDAMIFDGTSDEAFVSEKSNITKGFALLPNSLIDSHFVNRNRYGRLMMGVMEYPNFMGLGLAEDTGVVIKEGRFLECIGSGQVYVIDPTNLEIRTHQPLSYRNLTTHVLVKGDKFDLANQTFFD